MYKGLIKNILILIFPIFTFSSELAYAHRKFDVKNKTIVEIQKIYSSKITIYFRLFYTAIINFICDGRY